MTSASALLRQGAISPPAALRPPVALVKRLVEAARDESMGDPVDAAFSGYRDGSESLISILGKRGSGKTTLLAGACAELEGERLALVLPTVRPETFESTDSLLLAVLVELESSLASGPVQTRKPLVHDAEPSEVELDLASALSEAMRSVSVSTRGAFEAMAMARESTGQYGVDAVSIVRHRSRLDVALRQLFAALRRHSDVSVSMPVVVPIDDADMSPANVRSVLSAVRVLGTVPGLIPIICADKPQLEIAVRADILRQYDDRIGDDEAKALAAQVIAKLLRPERVVSPPTLSVRDRLHFTPIGEPESISQMLNRVGSETGTSSLGGLVWESSPASREREPESVNAWLPASPRELVHLWESISALKRTLLHQSAYDRAQHVERFVQYLLAGTGEYEVQVETRDSRGRGKMKAAPHIVLRWPNMRYGVASQGRFASAVTTRQLRVRVRRLSNVRAALFPDVSDAISTDGRSDRRELSPAAVSSMQALQELVLAGLLGGPSPTAPSFIGEDECEFLQAVAMNGETTDDRFLVLPDSCGAQAITKAVVTWNRIVEFARESNRRHKEPGASAAARLLVHIVPGYWLHGDTRALNVIRLPSFVNATDRASLEYLKLVRNDDVSHLEDYSPARAFCHWFERGLPYLFHSLILGETAAEAAVGRWLDAVSAGPRAVEATGALRTALEDRFAQRFDEQRRRRSGEHSWIFGYHALGRNLGTELYADILTLRDAFDERRRTRAVGQDVLADSVGLSNAKGPYEYQPHRTVEGDEEMAVLSEVLELFRSR